MYLIKDMLQRGRNRHNKMEGKLLSFSGFLSYCSKRIMDSSISPQDIEI